MWNCQVELSACVALLGVEYLNFDSVGGGAAGRLRFGEDDDDLSDEPFISNINFFHELLLIIACIQPSAHNCEAMREYNNRTN